MLINAQKKDEKKVKPENPKLVLSEINLKRLKDADAGNYKYSVEDYFGTPELSDLCLSPDGKYLSFIKRDVNGKNHIMARDSGTDKITLILKEKDNVILGYSWATDKHLIYIMDSGGIENYHIYAVDSNGLNDNALTLYQGVRASILKSSPEFKESLIIQMNKYNKDFFEPYKININTGETIKLYNNATNTIETYDFDKYGTLRGFAKINDTNVQNYYKLTGEKEFKLLDMMKGIHKF
ncbi:hypothetical protein CMU01_00595 [Elizabethkingia anophelis]|nr:hypothetical protein [Elizabethkingia anophelis]